MKKLNITFCSFPDFSGNAKALYEYMVKTYKDNMNYTWVVCNKNSVIILKRKGINAILMGTEECNQYIPKTNVFFTTHANLAGDKRRCKNAIYVELWHGIGPKPVGFLTKNITKRDSKWYDFLSETIDYLITTSSLFNLIFSTSFRIKPERVLNLGLPILDEVVYSQGIDNLKKIYGSQIDKFKKIIFYSPTFKKGCGRGLEFNYNQNNILNLHPYDEQKLINYLHTNNYLLLIKYHPSDEIKYKRINDENIKYLDNKTLENNNLNIDQILNSFDLLVTDFSSLGLEFSFLDRPVIYLDTDYVEYYQNRGILLDDYNFWTDGNTCNTINDLIKMIDNQINIKVINSNKKAIFSELIDGGCDKICEYFFTSDFKLNKHVKRYNSKLLDIQKELCKVNDIVKNLNNRIQYLEEKEQELASIKYSRSYKIVKKISKFKSIIVKK